MKIKKKELTKKGAFTKNALYDWYDRLMYYILVPIKNVDGFKSLNMNLFRTKDYSKPERLKILYGDGKK